MFADGNRDFVVLMVDENYQVFDCRNDPFFDDCIDSIKKRSKYAAGDLSMFE